MMNRRIFLGQSAAVAGLAMGVSTQARANTLKTAQDEFENKIREAQVKHMQELIANQDLKEKQAALAAKIAKTAVPQPISNVFLFSKSCSKIYSNIKCVVS
jgi:secreted PhoX family phosphatase